LEFENWKLEIGNWKLEFGIWDLEFRIWNLEGGIWKLELGSGLSVVSGSCQRYQVGKGGLPPLVRWHDLNPSGALPTILGLMHRTSGGKPPFPT
jgi:hypothetical protein